MDIHNWGRLSSLDKMLGIVENRMFDGVEGGMF